MDHPDHMQQQNPDHQQQSTGGTHIVYSSPSMAALSSPMPHQKNPGSTHVVYSSASMAYAQPMPHQQSSPMPHQQVSYAQPALLHTPQQQEQLRAFWANQMQEIEQTTDFRNHTLPLARIKKIMKADEDVRMISAEAPVVFAKACEIFILELTLRSWIHTEENKRRTLQKNDIAAAITRTDVFDFLVDIIPRDELKEEGLGVIKAGIPMGDGLPYYYLPPPQHAMTAASGMMMGNPVEPGGVYPSRQARMLPFMPWPHDAGQDQGGSRQQGSQQQRSDS